MTVLAGVLSAFLVNDAICLVMTPIVLQVVRSLGRNPLPYLVAVATASNCGSVATITGNPQNMVIGTLSRIPYPAFAAALAPVAAFGLIAVIVMVRLVYAQEFAFKGELEPHLFRGHMHGGQVLKASVTCVALAIAFFAGVAPAKAAIIGGAFLLLTRQIKPHRIYRELDGPLLILFAGMFVVVAGAEKALLTPDRIAMAKTLGLDMVWRLSLFTAVLSNIVSNVPAVLALRPFIPTFADPAARLARGRDELDAGRQFHPARIGRQPHRRRTRPRGGHADQLLGLFQGRRAADDHHARGGDVVADVAVARCRTLQTRTARTSGGRSRLDRRADASSRGRDAGCDPCANVSASAVSHRKRMPRKVQPKPRTSPHSETSDRCHHGKTPRSSRSRMPVTRPASRTVETPARALIWPRADAPAISRDRRLPGWTRRHRRASSVHGDRDFACVAVREAGSRCATPRSIITEVDFQMIYVLKGWYKTEFEGEGIHTFEAGAAGYSHRA